LLLEVDWSGLLPEELPLGATAPPALLLPLLFGVVLLLLGVVVLFLSMVEPVLLVPVP
jgi:hypothetical protein